MYFVAGTVSAYETDEAGVPVKGVDGRLQGRCLVKVPKEDGIPDGMTIDRCAVGLNFTEQSLSKSSITGLPAFGTCSLLLQPCKFRSVSAKYL